MTANLIGGAVLGAVVGELLKAVIDVAKTTHKFKSVFNRLKTTLIKIKPIFDDIDKLNKLLDPQQEGEKIAMFDLLKSGEELVLRCSSVQKWDFCKKNSYSKKLIALDESLLRFFQIDMQMDLSRDSKKTQFMVNDVSDKLDRLLSVVTNGGGGGGVCYSGGFPGICGVPGLPGRIVGLDVPLEELKVMVLKDDPTVVVLSAPGGCGKTTLACRLCHDEKIKDKFEDNIFFVTVSKTASLKDIVQKLFQHRGRQLPEVRTDEDALKQLEQLLTQIQANAILLVLDDVWSKWETLIEKFMFQIAGYKILVTSRFEFPRFDSTYKLGILNDEDAMTLFRYLAIPQDWSQEYEVADDVVNKMVKCCKGFPLALCVVGRSLYKRREAKWRRMLKNWSEGQSILDSNSDLLVCLQASLDALKEEMPQIYDCYLDLGSFPEDQRISATALVDIWVELYNLDEEGIDALDNLDDLSLRNLVHPVPTRPTDFVQGKEGSMMSNCCDGYFFTQHDLLREMAILQSSKGRIEERERMIIDVSGNDFPNWWTEQTQQPSNARLLSISTDETFSPIWYDMELPNAEVLILNSRTVNYALPEFVGRMDHLKVLIVTNYGFCPPELNNFSLLCNVSSLRRIRLEHVSISSVHASSLLQMKYLKKISLVMCQMGEAFDNCMVDLPNLVEIEIGYCDDLVELPVGICNVVSLKKLGISYCNELGALPMEIGRLINLEQLRLQSCTKLEELPESIGSLRKLSFLDMSGCVSMSIMPAQIGALRDLRTIHMRGCQGLCELPPSVKDLGALEHVICNEEVFYLWEPYQSHLTKLKIKVVNEDINLNWLHKHH